MGSFDLDYFIYGANVILLAAYSVRDMMWLRLLAVASSLCAIPYFLLQPTPLLMEYGWSVLFVGINLSQAWRLFQKRRPVKLTPEEEEVRRHVLGDLPLKEFLQVLNLGSWVDLGPGEKLITRNRSVECLYLIVRGKVRVARAGCCLGELGPGAIVGSALLLSGAVAEVDAMTTEATRTLRWEAATLERHLNANPETRSVFRLYLARDLAGKVQSLSPEIAATFSPPTFPGGQAA